MQMKRLYRIMRNATEVGAGSAGPPCSPRASAYHYAQLPACIVCETKRDALRSGNIRFSSSFLVSILPSLSLSFYFFSTHALSLHFFLSLFLCFFLFTRSLWLFIYSVSPFITSSLLFIRSLIRYPFSLSLPFFSRFTSCFYLSLLLLSFLSLHFSFYLSFHSFITFDLFPTFLCIFYFHPFFVSFYILLSI